MSANLRTVLWGLSNLWQPVGIRNYPWLELDAGETRVERAYDSATKRWRAALTDLEAGCWQAEQLVSTLDGTPSRAIVDKAVAELPGMLKALRDGNLAAVLLQAEALRAEGKLLTMYRDTAIPRARQAVVDALHKAEEQVKGRLREAGVEDGMPVNQAWAAHPEHTAALAALDSRDRALKHVQTRLEAAPEALASLAAAIREDVLTAAGLPAGQAA